MRSQSVRWLYGVLVTLCVVLLSVVSANAQPARPEIQAPWPPVELYRVDPRSPAQVFLAGFPPWSHFYPDAEVNHDLLFDLSGDTAQRVHAHERQQPEQPLQLTRVSNWVAASAGDSVYRNQIRLWATLDRPPLSLWVYVIRPSPRAYSVYWALRDYVQRNPVGQQERVRQARTILERDAIRDQWSFLDGIQIRNIVRAHRYDFNQDTRSYEASVAFESNRYAATQEAVGPMSSNPLDRFTASPTWHVYDYQPHLSDAAQQNGTLLAPQNLALSCHGLAGPAPHPRRQRSTRGDYGTGTTSSAEACPRADADIKAAHPPTKHRPSVLAFKLNSGTYCLTPLPESGYVGVELVACHTQVARFEYDEYQRLATVWNNNHWCLSAPQTVLAAEPTVSWDYVRFEPCVVNSQNQRWTIIDGQVAAYSSGYPLRERFYPILSSRRDFNPLRIDKRRFAADFFDAPSPARSHAVELEMGWSWNGTTYYSTYGSYAPWRRDYAISSYYDYKRQTISFIDLTSARSKPAHVPGKYCLKSNLAESNIHDWYWTDWKECNDLSGPVGWARRWKFDSRSEAARDPARVQWRDMADKPLWVAAKTEYNAGAYFSAQNDQLRYDGTSVRVFSIRSDAIRFGARFDPDE